MELIMAVNIYSLSEFAANELNVKSGYSPTAIFIVYCC